MGLEIERIGGIYANWFLAHDPIGYTQSISIMRITLWAIAVIYMIAVAHIIVSNLLIWVFI